MPSVSLVTCVNKKIICFLVCIAWRQWGTHAWVKHQEGTPLRNECFGYFQRPGLCVVCAWQHEAWCCGLLKRSVEMRENLFSISKFLSLHTLEEPTFNVSHSVQPLESGWTEAFNLHMMQPNKRVFFNFSYSVVSETLEPFIPKICKQAWSTVRN